MSTPSFCWVCGKKLRLPSFAIAKDQDGNVHRVHKVCLNSMTKPVTAAPKGEHVGKGHYFPEEK